MRNLMIGLVLGGLCLAGSALATGNDIFEVSLGGRFMFDGDYYSDSPAFDPVTSTYPLMGANQTGFGLGVAFGHHFQTKRGGFATLVKYNFATSPESDGVFYTDAAGDFVDTTTPVAGNISNSVTGTLSEHDLMLVFRMSSDLFPYDWMRNPNLFVDLGIGVTTLSYDYIMESQVVPVVGNPTTTTERTITRSGLAYSAGLGYNFNLDEDLKLAIRGDMLFGQIQDIEDSAGRLVRSSPNTNQLQLNLVLTKYFNSLF